jgi:uncharacterized membrane protein
MVWILTVAIVIGTIHRDAPLTPEIILRTSPNLFDLVIALERIFLSKAFDR